MSPVSTRDIQLCATFRHLQPHCRVPQKSVLRPQLYLLYSAELALVVDRHGLNLHQYADDTQVYVSTSASDAEAAVARLNA